MSKIKISKNNKVVAVDLYSNLLDKDRLSRLCKLFNLQDIYMDIYTVDIRKNNFYEKLVQSNLAKKSFCVPRKYLQDVHLKLAISGVPYIAKLLSDFEFEDLDIWDCYISWKTYLEDKTAKIPFFTFKSTKAENDGKFFLNYKESKVSIICDLVYDNQNLRQELSELIE